MKTALEILYEVTGGVTDYINIGNCEKAMKIYANQKLDEAANNIDWDNCYDGGQHCGRDAHEQSILNLKDEL